MQSEIAVFPLEGVLLPTMVLPLNVFEPRYLQLVQDVATTGNQFGVVLLRRGSEVGAPDAKADLARTRCDIGTMATIIESRSNQQSVQLLVVGAEPFRVDRWLDDAPYPRAAVSAWPEPQPEPQPEPLSPSPSPNSSDNAPAMALGNLDDSVRLAIAQLDELGSLLERQGVALGPLPDFSDDPVLAVDQLCVAAPLQPFDKQRLLESPGANERLALLCSLVSDLRTLVVLQTDREM